MHPSIRWKIADGTLAGAQIDQRQQVVRFSMDSSLESFVTEETQLLLEKRIQSILALADRFKAMDRELAKSTVYLKKVRLGVWVVSLVFRLTDSFIRHTTQHNITSHHTTPHCTEHTISSRNVHPVSPLPTWTTR